MYRNLSAELVRKGITKKQLAANMGLSEKAMSNRFGGITDFSLNEIVKIRELVAPEMTLEELFKEDV